MILMILKKINNRFFNNLKDQNLILSHHLVLKSLPLKIYKLVETINVEFLKKRFNLQSDLNIGPYNLNLNSRQISKNQLS